LYRELNLDSTTAGNPDVQERLRLIYHGNLELVADLRHLNPGRPAGYYDPFFDKLQLIVENATAADERRHNIWSGLQSSGISCPFVSILSNCQQLFKSA
jgi:hypothetical protein